MLTFPTPSEALTFRLQGDTFFIGEQSLRVLDCCNEGTPSASVCAILEEHAVAVLQHLEEGSDLAEKGYTFNFLKHPSLEEYATLFQCQGMFFNGTLIGVWDMPLAAGQASSAIPFSLFKEKYTPAFTHALGLPLTPPAVADDKPAFDENDVTAALQETAVVADEVADKAEALPDDEDEETEEDAKLAASYQHHGVELEVEEKGPVDIDIVDTEFSPAAHAEAEQMLKDAAAYEEQQKAAGKTKISDEESLGNIQFEAIEDINP